MLKKINNSKNNHSDSQIAFHEITQFNPDKLDIRLTDWETL